MVYIKRQALQSRLPTHRRNGIIAIMLTECSLLFSQYRILYSFDVKQEWYMQEIQLPQR